MSPTQRCISLHRPWSIHYSTATASTRRPARTRTIKAGPHRCLRFFQKHLSVTQISTLRSWSDSDSVLARLLSVVSNMSRHRPWSIHCSITTASTRRPRERERTVNARADIIFAGVGLEILIKWPGILIFGTESASSGHFRCRVVWGGKIISKIDMAGGQ